MSKMLSALAAVLLVAAIPAQAKVPTDVSSHLDQVLEQGYVRVCTTGDYKPFTYLNPETGKFQGIDIDMARDLAAALGVEARFVQTSWSTLMTDFTAGKCEIAVGGISINLERQQ